MTAPTPPTHQAAPPHDIEAEQAVLGGMMLTTAAAGEAEQVLGDGAAFYRHTHRTIYAAALALHGKPGVRADPITVAAELERAGDLARIGGRDYLHACVQAIPSAANTGWYAEIVHTKAQLRALHETGQRLAQRALTDSDPEQLLADTLAELQQLTAANTATAEEDLSVAGNWEPFIDELNQGHDPSALDTPWPDVNDKIQLKPKELIVVGAGTGGGKSLLGMNIAAHIALRRDLPVLVVSMEMSRKELLARLTASEAGVELNHLIRRQLTESDWQRIARINDRMLRARNFILDDSPAITVPKIRARVRWMTAKDAPPALVVVDYMQLITADHQPGRDVSRAQEVAKISRGLKLIADEFAIPVIALAQFNRGHVGRRPLVTDFKESSQIEQDASVILLLHRELAADGSDTGAKAGKVDLIVGKNRNGQQGAEITLQFQGMYGRLRSLAPAAWSPSAVDGAA